MADGTRNRRGAIQRIVIVAAAMIAASCTDTGGSAPPPSAPQNPAYPMQAAQPTAPAPQSHPFRDFFAATLAAVLQTSSAGIVGSLSGGLVSWFAGRVNHGNAQVAGQYPNGAYGSSTYPSSGYPSTYPGGAYPSGQSYPSAGSTYPNTASTYPNTASTYPNTASTYPSAGSTYPSGSSTYPSSGYPSTGSSTYPSGSSGYPSSGYPTASQGGSYPNTAQYPSGSSYPSGGSSTYPSGSGYPSGGQYPSGSTYPDSSGSYPNNSYPVASRDADSGVFAGIAFEVHALSPDGHWNPVDPNTYQFRSGDRFMVYYRPSLPGRMQIYNVNPNGQQTLIDASDMAAGQLSGLGPYEFTATTGDESLRLVLSPCSTPQLLVATRDIVKADAPPPSSAQTGGGVQLSNCGVVATRGLDVRTRDIQKVAQDGTTSFALDAVSQQELASGDVGAREVRIVFHHR